MKKIASIISVLTICAVVLFCGCSSNNVGYDKVISEIRSEVYVGEVNGYKFTGASGEREKNYKIDGVANGREDFFIFTVEGVFASAPTCLFTLGEKVYEGVMKKHPFNDSYSYEVNVKTNEKEVDVSVKCGNDTIQTKLKTVKTDSSITSSQALNKARSSLKKTLDKHLKNGVFDGEVYVRIIANPVDNDGRYFWYVAFCKSEKECFSALIDLQRGELIASKSE